ncbi:hypothetical protein GGF32_002434 [Allomyces javanicus]|nr:hypothetical protein GGF32_002434 [Allomyces javanicus]
MRILRQPRPLPSADAATDPLDLWLADPVAASRAFARAKFPTPAPTTPSCLAPSPLDSAAPFLLAAPPRPAPPRALAALPEPLPTIPVSLPAPSATELAACAPLPAWPACDDHGMMVAPVPWLTAHLPIAWPVAAAAAEQVDRDAMDVDAENENDDDDVPPAHGCGRVRLPTPPTLHVASRAPSPSAADMSKDAGRRRMRVPPTAPSTP